VRARACVCSFYVLLRGTVSVLISDDNNNSVESAQQQQQQHSNGGDDDSDDKLDDLSKLGQRVATLGRYIYSDLL